MKKTAKILISLLLIVSVALSIASCDVLKSFSRLKNGPGTTYADLHKSIWVDTYDEMVTVLSEMKAAGTKTPQIPTFNCDEHGIDVKFQIIIRKSDIADLEAEQSYYDVKLINIDIKCYLFFEDVSLEEAYAFGIYGPDMSCRYYKIEKYESDDVLSSYDGVDDLDIHNIDDSGNSEIGRYHIYYNGKNQFYIQKSWADFELTEEQIEILEKTLVVID